MDAEIASLKAERDEAVEARNRWMQEAHLVRDTELADAKQAAKLLSFDLRKATEERDALVREAQRSAAPGALPPNYATTQCRTVDDGTPGDSPRTAEEQIEQLARFIMAEVPGEPSQSEGAVDTAIRIMRKQRDFSAGRAVEEVLREPYVAAADRAGWTRAREEGIEEMKMLIRCCAEQDRQSFERGLVGIEGLEYTPQKNSAPDESGTGNRQATSPPVEPASASGAPSGLLAEWREALRAGHTMYAIRSVNPLGVQSVWFCELLGYDDQLPKEQP
jgi:hypothetical protein